MYSRLMIAANSRARSSRRRSDRNPPRRFTGRRQEVLAVAVVVAMACASWFLVQGAATAVYRHFAVYGSPPLALIQRPGVDPDPVARAARRGPVSQLGNTGYFWSERAFHYRTVLMFATDGARRPADLAHDTAQQYPEGVNAWREYTLFMEPLYGALYRLFGDRSRPVVEFLLGLVPLVHVLLFLPLYAAARLLGVGRLAAVGTVAAYASCRLGFARLAGSLLLKEDLALLLLLCFVAAHLWAWRRGGYGRLALAAALLAALLASWHLSQFLVAVVLGAAAWARAAAGASATWTTGWRLPVAYLIGGAVAAATPSLAERSFWAAPPFLLLVAWAAAEALPRRWPALGATARARFAVLGGGFLALLAVAALNRSYAGDYGHVGGLLVSKLAHGLRQPADPGALPFAARVFWTSPFHTPDLAEVWRGVGLMLPLLVVGVGWAAVRAWRPRGIDPATRAVLATVPLFAALWVLAARLGVVFLPFGVIAAALAAQAWGNRLASVRRGAALPAGMVAASLFVVAALNVPVNLGDDVRIARDVRSGRPAAIGASDDDRAAARAELFDWIRRNTRGAGGPGGGPPAAFLADIGLSPQLLLYCDRPVVLNSQFENAPVRTRYERYLTALFAGDEQPLHDLAREVRADYLVVDRDQATGAGRGSLPYQAGVAGSLALGTTAARLHFAPESLRHFTPVYGNDVFRVYRVGSSAAATATSDWPGQASMWWRLANYTVADGKLVDPRGDRARLAAVAARVARLQNEQGRLLAGAEPSVIDLRRRAVLARLGGPESGFGATVARLDAAIGARLQRLDGGSGRTVGQALAALAPSGATVPDDGSPFGDAAADPLHLAIAGQLAAVLGHFDAAADFFHRATTFWPSRPGPMPLLQGQLRDETVCWLLAAGRAEEARRLADRWWDDLPPALQRDSFIARLRAAGGVAEVVSR